MSVWLGKRHSNSSLIWVSGGSYGIRMMSKVFRFEGGKGNLNQKILGNPSPVQVQILAGPTIKYLRVWHRQDIPWSGGRKTYRPSFHQWSYEIDAIPTGPLEVALRETLSRFPPVRFHNSSLIWQASDNKFGVWFDLWMRPFNRSLGCYGNTIVGHCSGWPWTHRKHAPGREGGQ